MGNIKLIEWVLRIAIFGEFLGHGLIGLQGKEQWVGWVSQLTGVSDFRAAQILSLIGLLDIAVAVVILVKPLRPVVLWAVIWGFWTALLRPIVGESPLDFVERWANWGAPLALFLLLGLSKKLKNLPKEPAND